MAGEDGLTSQLRQAGPGQRRSQRTVARDDQSHPFPRWPFHELTYTLHQESQALFRREPSRIQDEATFWRKTELRQEPRAQRC